ncbi:MAG: glucokinase [Cyanobacteria bacterium P01_A01_bin.114]
MQTLLAGDIGGTKTILRLAEFAPAEPPTLNSPLVSTLYEQTYPSQAFSDLVPLVKTFFAEVNEQRGLATHPTVACFGIAGPVVCDQSELTNLRWSLDARRLERELAIATIELINDFAANGYGILGLSESDLFTVQAVPPQPDAPIAVIGAGTGLGEGFLIRQDGQYRVFASEGGHTDFAPQTERAFQLCHYLQKREQLPRISTERIVSGIGIVSIYQFLRDEIRLAAESAPMTAAFQTWEAASQTGEEVDSPAVCITQSAIAGSDMLAQQTMELFVQAYGAEAGDLALKLLPYGGLYVTGGIAAKILPLMKTGGFLDAFLNKGRVSPLLKQVPVHIVLNPKVGLIGAALHAAQLSSQRP